MSVTKILEDDWSDYDNKKKKKDDANFFACSEYWEVDYLKNKIQKHHPLLSDEKIEGAIDACCMTIGSPHPRKAFVECVAKRLRIRMF